jgi:hypothetical protein
MAEILMCNCIIKHLWRIKENAVATKSCLHFIWIVRINEWRFVVQGVRVHSPPLVGSMLRLEQIIMRCLTMPCIEWVMWVLSRTNYFGASGLGWLEHNFLVRQENIQQKNFDLRQKSCRPCL